MCRIIKASAEDAEAVFTITHSTIKAVYPHYYPSGAVDFFLKHHSMKNILRDINAGEVWLLLTNAGGKAGTVTVNKNETNRLFVLPELQGGDTAESLLYLQKKRSPKTIRRQC